MKVIKEGKWNVPWSAELSCKTCEARLLVEESDVKARDYYNDGFTFTCPLCGKVSVINGSELPLRVQEEKNKRRLHPGRDPRD